MTTEEDDPVAEAVFYADIMIGAERDWEDYQSVKNRKHVWRRKTPKNRKEKDPLMVCKKCEMEASQSEIRQGGLPFCEE